MEQAKIQEIQAKNGLMSNPSHKKQSKKFHFSFIQKFSKTNIDEFL